MLESIILGATIAKIKGYEVKKIIYIKEFYFIIFAKFLVLWLQINIYFENYEILKYSNSIKFFYLCSFLPLIFKVEFYKETILASIFIFFGVFLNDIVSLSISILRKNSGGVHATLPSICLVIGITAIFII